MTAFPAVSLPHARQGTSFPCRLAFRGRRQAVQAIAGKWVLCCGRGGFQPRQRNFSLCFPCGREDSNARYRPDPRRRVGRPGSARSCSDRARPSDPLSRPRPPETVSSGTPDSFLSACARSRRSSSKRVRIVAKSSAARGRFTFPLLKIWSSADAARVVSSVGWWRRGGLAQPRASAGGEASENHGAESRRQTLSPQVIMSLH